MLHHRGIWLASLAFGLVLNGCAGSEFASGSGGGTKSSSSKDKKDQDEPADDPEENDPKDEPTDSSTNTETETDQDDKAKGGDLVNEEQASCLLERGDDFRMLFVLDNSGSTTKTDPDNVRKKASLKLIDQFTDFAKANPKVKFRTATVAVHGTKTGHGQANDPGEGAQAGPNKWVDLKPSTRSKIEQDVDAGTDTSSTKGTYFIEGFKEAAKLLEEDGAKGDAKKQRNYVIFLTDGQANGPNDSMTSIPAAVDDLTSDFGVAVYSIMIGKAANTAGIDSAKLMQSLALPKTGKVGKDHVGTYVHAESPDEIEKAFSDFFKLVTTCK